VLLFYFVLEVGLSSQFGCRVDSKPHSGRDCLVEMALDGAPRLSHTHTHTLVYDHSIPTTAVVCVAQVLIPVRTGPCGPCGGCNALSVDSAAESK